MKIIEVRTLFTSVLTFMLSMLFLLGNTSAFYASGIPEITEQDRQECRQLAEQFCQAWMNGQYEVMYQALSKKGMGKMDKNKFIRTYKGYEAEGQAT